MKPGTYDVTLYQGELEAGTGRVTVSAGQTASVSLSVTISRPNVIWSIGECAAWDPLVCPDDPTAQVPPTGHLLGKKTPSRPLFEP